MLPVNCQISKVASGQTCTTKPCGFVVCPGDSPLALYKEGTVLCSRHGEAAQEVRPGSQFVTISELADMMTQEDKSNQRQQSSVGPITHEEISMNTVAETPVVVMTVLPSAPIDLQALAHKVNGSSVDTPHQAPKVIDVPSVPAPPTMSATPAELGRILSEEELEEKALAEQIRVLMAQKDAIKKARIAREKAEAEAARQAKVLAHDPLYQFEQAAALRATVMLSHGSTVLQAVETLLEAGVLTVRNGALHVKKVGDKAEDSTPTPTAPRVPSVPRSTSSRVQYSEDMVRQVQALKAQNKTDKDIEAILHIGVGDGKAAWALRNRRTA